MYSATTCMWSEVACVLYYHLNVECGGLHTVIPPECECGGLCILLPTFKPHSAPSFFIIIIFL